jgi:hypothetical protein
MDQQNNQNVQQNQAQKTNTQNNRNQIDRQKPRNIDKRPPQDRSSNPDKARADRNPAGERVQGGHNFRIQSDAANGQKPRDQRAPNKPENNQPARNQQPQPAGQNQNTQQAYVANNQNRYARGNAVKNIPQADVAGRNIKAKRIETVEDIQADIERIDKDIQFEIKQIRAVKLGL